MQPRAYSVDKANELIGIFFKEDEFSGLRVNKYTIDDDTKQFVFTSDDGEKIVKIVDMK